MVGPRKPNKGTKIETTITKALENTEAAEINELNKGNENIADIAKDETKNALKNMKNGKGPREDGTVIDTIKVEEEVLLEKIQNLFNMCLFDNIILSEWSKVLMMLIQKREDPTEVQNFKPLSTSPK
ncbi:hypothetical protein HUJ05_000728 [Dendroctonus ponderosae]|uniref:Uncharacterized protein n=1 Tax=Dendroctonus ponderosae TaxID=77166 RepID=A0AAR5P787_DENPD|nr:hypothetical protein HUJ05_000728 [Dendroctonus ponderosae]